MEISEKKSSKNNNFPNTTYTEIATKSNEQCSIHGINQSNSFKKSLIICLELLIALISPNSIFAGNRNYSAFEQLPNGSSFSDTTIYQSASSCGPYEWFGQTIVFSGTYEHHSGGLYSKTDTLYILDLTVTIPIKQNYTDTICRGERYNRNGFDFIADSSGIYHNLVDCIQYNLFLIVFDSSNTTIYDTTCQSYTWDDSTYYQSGTYQRYYNTIRGCDSIVTLHLSINQPQHSTDYIETCDSILWEDGQWYYSDTDTSFFILPSASQNGCDSIKHLHLHVYHSTCDTINISSCSSYVWNGIEHDTSGTYILHLSTIHGCDSTLILNLEINKADTIYIDDEVCSGSTYQQYNFSYVAVPSTLPYIHYDTIHLVNSHLCDSTVFLKLRVNPVDSSNLTLEACSAYTWLDTTIYESGTYTQRLSNNNGCDSIVTMKLTILQPGILHDTIEACDSMRWGYNGNWYYEDNDTDFVILPISALNGCDSIVSLHLTIKHSPEVSDIIGDSTACLNQYIAFDYYIQDTTTYTFHWNINGDNSLINQSPILYHIANDTNLTDSTIPITMQVTDNYSNCSSFTVHNIHVCGDFSPDPSEIIRKPNSNILVCSPETSSFGQVHYRWGYTDKATFNETVNNWDYNYYQYDIPIDTTIYDFWVETYIVYADRTCHNRAYFSQNQTTGFDDIEKFNSIVFVSGNQIVIRYQNPECKDIKANLYDISGRLLFHSDFGTEPSLDTRIPFDYDSGTYILELHTGNRHYTSKITR